MRTLAIILLLLAGTAYGGQPVVRAKVDGKSAVVAGQQVTVTVTVLVPNFFASSVQWPALEIPGATATLAERGMNVNDTIGGEQYAGVQRSYLIVPQREGDYSLPAAKVTFKYTAVPGKPPVAGEVTLPAIKFSAKLPAGATPGSSAAPAARVTIRQSIDRDLAGLKAGDALTRTLDIFAEHTQAMMIPPPEFKVPDGARLYRRDPMLTDMKSDRGEFLGGRRVDSATYVFEKPGDYTLPAIEIGWFNAVANKSEKAIAPEIRVTIAAGSGASAIAPEAPAAGEAPAKARTTIPWKLLGAILAALAFAVFAARWLFARLAAPLRDWIDGERHKRAESEPAYAARVVRACAANDPQAAYRAFLAWNNRRATPITAMLREEVDALERALYGKAATSEWKGAPLASALEAARKDRGSREPHASALPLLNP